MTPAETLRAAAATLHAAYDDVAAHSDGWAQGRPLITLAQHCNPEVVHFVRTMSPAVALGFAASLDAIADEMKLHGAVEGAASKAVHPMTVLGLGAPRADWTAALAVARAILGEVNSER